MNHPASWVLGVLVGVPLVSWLIYDTFLRKHSLRELVAGKRVTLLLLERQGNISPLSGHLAAEISRYAYVVSNDLTSEDLTELGYSRMELLEHRTNQADYLIIGEVAKTGEVVFTVLDCCSQQIRLQVHLGQAWEELPLEPVHRARSLFERFEQNCFDELLKPSSS